MKTSSQKWKQALHSPGKPCGLAWPTKRLGNNKKSMKTCWGLTNDTQTKAKPPMCKCQNNMKAYSTSSTSLLTLSYPKTFANFSDCARAAGTLGVNIVPSSNAHWILCNNLSPLRLWCHLQWMLHNREHDAIPLLRSLGSNAKYLITWRCVSNERSL